MMRPPPRIDMKADKHGKVTMGKSLRQSYREYRRSRGTFVSFTLAAPMWVLCLVGVAIGFTLPLWIFLLMALAALLTNGWDFS